VGPRTGVNNMERKKNPALLELKFRPLGLQHVAGPYTDCAIKENYIRYILLIPAGKIVQPNSVLPMMSYSQYL
jgi:hypothetical protein